MRMYVDPKVLEEIGSENAVIVANHHYGLFHYIRRWLKTKNFLIVFGLLFIERSGQAVSSLFEILSKFLLVVDVVTDSIMAK